MIDKKEIYTQIGELLPSLAPFYSERVAELQYKHKAPSNWFALNNVRADESKPVPITHIHRRQPYTSIDRQFEIYNTLAEEGLLEVVEKGSYLLTEQGRQLIEGFFQIAHEDLAPVDVMPGEKTKRLEKLLSKVVKSTLEAEEPAEKLVLKSSRWTDPGEDASAVAKIDQYVTDLIRFRDDAHYAAWRRLEVDGKTWEAFTQVEQGEADDSSSLAERLSNRGYSEEDYADSLQNLGEKGWLEEVDNKWQPTSKGKQIKEKVENETDRLFFASWNVLGEEELTELAELIGEANENLRYKGQAITWDLALKLGQTIPAAANDVVRPLFEKYFAQPATFFPTLMASGKAPEPYSAQDHGLRFPYINPDRINQVLSDAADSGLLSSFNGGYKLSNKGQEAIESVNDVFYSRLGEIDSVLEDDSQALAELLHKLVDASLEATEPESKWSLTNMHDCHLDKSYNSLAKIDQYLDDLNAFRDDVHIAAWQPYDIDGRSWEAFTFVWRGDVSTAEELVEKLPNRGYDEADYEESLDLLVKRGWLEQSGNEYATTKQGQAIRNEAEETTNRYFFAPWDELSSSEKFRLRTLLTRTRLRLQSLIEEQQAEELEASPS